MLPMTNIKSKKYAFLVFLLMSLSFSVWALFPQKAKTLAVKTYPYKPIDSVYRFIKYKENNILLEDKTTANLFFSKLDSLRAGLKNKVSILHLGDSHIQADFLSGKIRQLFQNDDEFGDGGHGLAFPYNITKTNNPTWYKSTYTGTWQSTRINKPSCESECGINGAEALTYDKNANFTVNVCAYDGHCRTFNKVKIFGYIPDYDLFELKITAKSDTTFYIKSIEVDSVLHVTEYTLSQSVSSASFSLVKKLPTQNKFIFTGLSLENEDRGIVYHSVGLNGATAGTFIKSNKLINQTASLSPDLIIISLGTNDAFSSYFSKETFEYNLSALVEKLHVANPKTFIIITTPGDSFRKGKANPNYAITSKTIKEIAHAYGCGVWDFYKVMGGANSIAKWYKKQLCQADRLHLTRKGYELQANLLFDALMKCYVEE
ncbi:MAG: hypothetical protein RLZZ175_1384 [Bacteroidota bacterium]|jgi:lysophospholipase L1-like esterase